MPVKSSDILYCIEHEARELDIACAVRAILRREFGIRSDLHFLTNQLDSTVGKGEYGLVVVPSCTTREFAHKSVFQRFPRLPVLNLACEQLFSPANRHYRLPRDAFARKHVLHVAAGDFFREWLLQAGVPSKHIALAGSMTFQLYRPPYRQFFESRREALAAAHGLDNDLPWVFLPENFGAAFFKPSHMRKRIRGGYDRAQLAAYVDYTRRSLGQIARWCRVASAAGRIELIVRPRPAVSQAVFMDAFVEASGGRPPRHLHFIKDGNVREWIFASQLVVSSYSTTLLEAAVADKPAYLLAPIAAPESAGSEWHEFAPRVSDQDGFLQLVADAAHAEPSHRLRQWAFENLLGHGDAIANIARTIHQICTGVRCAPSPHRPAISSLVAGSAREGLRRTERWIRNRLRPRRRQNFVYQPSSTDMHAIERRTGQWAELLEHAGHIRAA